MALASTFRFLHNSAISSWIVGLDQVAFSKSILMIIHQQLVTTLCEHCKENYHPTKDEFDSLANFYGEKYFPELGVEYKEDLQIKKPVGCKKCLYSGYGKKTAIQEIMDGTAELSKLIASKASMKYGSAPKPL